MNAYLARLKALNFKKGHTPATLKTFKTSFEGFEGEPGMGILKNHELVCAQCGGGIGTYLGDRCANHSDSGRLAASRNAAGSTGRAPNETTQAATGDTTSRIPGAPSSMAGPVIATTTTGDQRAGTVHWLEATRRSNGKRNWRTHDQKHQS